MKTRLFRTSLYAILLALLTVYSLEVKSEDLTRYVNTFIGTTNYGTTNPGAVCPNGLMSVTPFNVMGSDDNRHDKDKQWWSTPYDFRNKYLTGFSHVNLSGVGCPDLSSLLLMPTTGQIEVDYKKYGSHYTDEKSTPGYYSNKLTKYNVLTELTSSMRCAISRFTFPKGQSNILLNLGEGLTNESGAMVRFVSDTEIEGSKLLGTFCYNDPQAVFPIYFVMKVSKQPANKGYWKKQREVNDIEKEWDALAGKYKLYENYNRELSGDDIGVFFSYSSDKQEVVEVRMGVSFVSIDNARLNLETELSGKSFEDVRLEAKNKWNEHLSVVTVEGGTDEQKRIFYSALYHTLIHPNIITDVNGEYPSMTNLKTMKSNTERYTVFSLWDTYRNLHQLITLLYPQKQIDMVNSMIGMYKESGWLPKWELYSRETLTMEGDPSIPVITDTYLKGLRGFDIHTAYEAMYKSATTAGKYNLMRPDNDDYLSLGYVPLRANYDNSVSHALEYYVADNALSLLAQELGKKADSKLFRNRALGYRHYYCKDFGTLRPLLPDGSFFSPFNPKEGVNFEPCNGFHEGTAWNYTFYVPHDVYGLAKLMGGKKNFVKKLQSVFDNGFYDPANEPDIAYAYLFSYFKGEEWRTQKLTLELLDKYFHNAPNGIPGNDDAGTMSAWAIFSMIGIYPDCPGSPYYTITKPVFDKITIKLDEKHHGTDKLIIEKSDNGLSKDKYIKQVFLGEKRTDKFRISHKELLQAKKLKLVL